MSNANASFNTASPKLTARVKSLLYIWPQTGVEHPAYWHGWLDDGSYDGCGHVVSVFSI